MNIKLKKPYTVTIDYKNIPKELQNYEYEAREEDDVVSVEDCECQDGEHFHPTLTKNGKYKIDPQGKDIKQVKLTIS